LLELPFGTIVRCVENRVWFKKVDDINPDGGDDWLMVGWDDSYPAGNIALPATVLSYPLTGPRS
jgi:hypothetical protein